MSTAGKITRRTFLLGSVAIAGGVAFGYYKYKQPYPNPLPDYLTGRENAPPGVVSITPYLLIDNDGITIVTPRAEMGQGIHSTLAALVAEELDVAWNDIRTTHGPVSNAYYNRALLEGAAPFPSFNTSQTARNVRGAMGVAAKFLGMQVTGGSSAVADAYQKMRVAGAAARLVLIEAAARRWSASIQGLRTHNGFVINLASDERLHYTALASVAATIDLPSKPILKERSQWRYLGNSMPRTDMLAKCTGTAQFGIDIQRPDMLYATVITNPNLGATMQSYDDSAAKSMRGVRRIVPLQNGVAVVADNTWRAFKAANALKFSWAEAPYPRTTHAIFEQISGAIDTMPPDAIHRNDGDAEAALNHAGRILEAEYRAPFLAHSTMEPMNAVAHLTDDALHIWAGHQAPTELRDAAAEVVELEPSQVHVHVEFLGGGFGRRPELDFGLQAVAIAKDLKGIPVKLTWTREEDIRHDFYRPGAVGRFKGTIGDNGLPETVQMKIASPSVLRSLMERSGIPAIGPDRMIVEGSCDQPYTIPNYQVIAYAPDLKIPLGTWRSVGASFNGFFHECFLDELAIAGDVDPLQMRLAMTREFPIAHAVLGAVAEMSDWSTPLPKGRARGLAMTLSFGSYVAQVVEISDTPNGISIDKVYCVVDPGVALDPGNIEAQMQSGILYGLSAAVMGEITFADGVVEQSNFHDYGALQLSQAPEIAVRILQNGPTLRGIGEPGTPPSKPALANAVYALTGKRIREYPLNRHLRFA